MVSIATEQVKAQLDDLLNRASQGETIVITDRGLPIARLMPIEKESQGSTGFQEMLASLRDIRSRSKLAPGESITDLIRGGRKY